MTRQIAGLSKIEKAYRQFDAARGCLGIAMDNNEKMGRFKKGGKRIISNLPEASRFDAARGRLVDLLIEGWPKIYTALSAEEWKPPRAPGAPLVTKPEKFK